MASQSLTRLAGFFHIQICEIIPVPIYSVTANCPTPLAENPYHTLAKSEKQAIARFFRRNGISGTDHELTVIEREPGNGIEIDDTPGPDAEPEKSESDLILEQLIVNPTATNKEVVAALKEQGVTVHSAQVTEVKKQLSEAANVSDNDSTGGDSV